MNMLKNANQVVAIIAAAGTGCRMGSILPKQYIKILDKTILEHAVNIFLSHHQISKIIVALHPEDELFSLLPLAKNSKIMTVQGGETRAQSVNYALNEVNDDEKWVLIHDAARPCLCLEDLTNLLTVINYSTTGGILATPIRDTLKKSDRTEAFVNETIARDNVWAALTPQIFPSSLIKKCLQTALLEGKTVTDESSALELYGYHPLIVKGKAQNIKITTKDDLDFATYYLMKSMC